MGNMRFKVGDRVRIKSLDWYNENRTKHGDIWFDNAVFVGGQSLYCGCELTIRLVTNDSYYVIENDYYWIDEMIEGLVEEESANYSKVIDNGMSNPIIAKTSSATIDTDKCFYSYSDSDGNLEMKWNLPQGYQFVDENGNVINATKIVLEKKKKGYPKTFKECQDYLGEDVAPMAEPISKTHRRKSVHLLEILLTCRDAYWKIAGEEMGLGKPWEPDWEDSLEVKYCITVSENKITMPFTRIKNRILAFPTEEMRDAFYENFKELIEQCKELL